MSCNSTRYPRSITAEFSFFDQIFSPCLNFDNIRLFRQQARTGVEIKVVWIQVSRQSNDELNYQDTPQEAARKFNSMVQNIKPTLLNQKTKES